MHGGSLTAQSEGKDKGSTFTLALPLSAVGPVAGTPVTSVDTTPVTSITTSPPTASFSSPAHCQHSQLFIMVVEDNETTLMILSRMLGTKHRVVTARSCEEARHVVMGLPRDSIDLLLSDLGLPDGHGCELLSELRGECTPTTAKTS